MSLVTSVHTPAETAHSLYPDPVGSLRMNLIFYLKGETYTGNSGHFSLLLQQGCTLFLKS